MYFQKKVLKSQKTRSRWERLKFDHHRTRHKYWNIRTRPRTIWRHVFIYVMDKCGPIVTVDGPEGWIHIASVTSLIFTLTETRRQKCGPGMGWYYYKLSGWTFLGWRCTQNQLPKPLPVYWRHVHQPMVKEKVCLFQEKGFFSGILFRIMLHHMRWSHPLHV